MIICDSVQRTVILLKANTVYIKTEQIVSRGMTVPFPPLNKNKTTTKIATNYCSFFNRGKSSGRFCSFSDHMQLTDSWQQQAG